MPGDEQVDQRARLHPHRQPHRQKPFRPPDAAALGEHPAGLADLAVEAAGEGGGPPASRRRAARSRISEGATCGIRAAGVPGRGE